MKLADLFTSSTNSRCQHLSPKGRRCRQPACPSHPSLCFSHAPKPEPPPAPSDELVQAAASLSSPEDIRRFLTQLLLALAQGPHHHQESRHSRLPLPDAPPHPSRNRLPPKSRSRSGSRQAHRLLAQLPFRRRRTHPQKPRRPARRTQRDPRSPRYFWRLSATTRRSNSTTRPHSHSIPRAAQRRPRSPHRAQRSKNSRVSPSPNRPQRSETSRASRSTKRTAPAPARHAALLSLGPLHSPVTHRSRRIHKHPSAPRTPFHQAPLVIRGNL